MLALPERRGDEAVAFEQLGAEQFDPTREGRERLIRRVTGPGRAERENLPPRLLHRRERFDPPVRDRAEIADAERPGEAGRVEENPRGSRECRGAHRVALAARNDLPWGSGYATKY